MSEATRDSEDGAVKVPHDWTVERITYTVAFSGPLKRWLIQRDSRAWLPEPYEDIDAAQEVADALNAAALSDSRVPDEG